MHPQPKRIPYRNKKLTQSAKGEACTIEAHGCCGGTETTVAAHFNHDYAGKGMGQKADDCAIVFACHQCHMTLDAGYVDDRRLLRAYYRTIRRLIDKGVLK